MSQESTFLVCTCWCLVTLTQSDSIQLTVEIKHLPFPSTVLLLCACAWPYSNTPTDLEVRHLRITQSLWVPIFSKFLVHSFVTYIAGSSLSSYIILSNIIPWVLSLQYRLLQEYCPSTIDSTMTFLGFCPYDRLPLLWWVCDSTHILGFHCVADIYFLTHILSSLLKFNSLCGGI